MDFDQISRFSEIFWIGFFVKWGKCCGNRTTRAIRMIFGALERNLAEFSIFFWSALNTISETLTNIEY